jgi:hypothetical protein
MNILSGQIICEDRCASSTYMQINQNIDPFCLHIYKFSGIPGSACSTDHDSIQRNVNIGRIQNRFGGANSGEDSAPVWILTI